MSQQVPIYQKMGVSPQSWPCRPTKTHVTDDPTEAEVNVLLDLMGAIFTRLEGGGVGLRVVWADTIPAEIQAEMKSKDASFVLRESDTDYAICYTGDRFKEKPRPAFVNMRCGSSLSYGED